MLLQTLSTEKTFIPDSDRIIKTGVDAKQFMQEIKFGGKKEKFFYKDSKLMLLDETYARKLIERENPRVDFEEAKKDGEEFL